MDEEQRRYLEMLSLVSSALVEVFQHNGCLPQDRARSEPPIAITNFQDLVACLTPDTFREADYQAVIHTKLNELFNLEALVPAVRVVK